MSEIVPDCRPSDIFVISEHSQRQNNGGGGGGGIVFCFATKASYPYNYHPHFTAEQSSCITRYATEKFRPGTIYKNSWTPNTNPRISRHLKTKFMRNSYRYNILVKMCCNIPRGKLKELLYRERHVAKATVYYYANYAALGEIQRSVRTYIVTVLTVRTLAFQLFVFSPFLVKPSQSDRHEWRIRGRGLQDQQKVS